MQMGVRLIKKQDRSRTGIKETEKRQNLVKTAPRRGDIERGLRRSLRIVDTDESVRCFGVLWFLDSMTLPGLVCEKPLGFVNCAA